MKKLVVFKSFLSKILEIYTGWKNFVFRKIEIEILYHKRIPICNSCEFYSKYKICTRCSCPGAGKARSPKSKCPLGKWENDIIIINNNNKADVPMVNFNSSDDYLDYINKFNN
jgi:hypothetical protein